jgi:hypothetical protein
MGAADDSLFGVCYPFLTPMIWPRDSLLYLMFEDFLMRELFGQLGSIDLAVFMIALRHGFRHDAESTVIRTLAYVASQMTLSKRLSAVRLFSLFKNIIWSTSPSRCMLRLSHVVEGNWSRPPGYRSRRHDERRIWIPVNTL